MVRDLVAAAFGSAVAASADRAQLLINVVSAFGLPVHSGVRASLQRDDGLSLEVNGGSKLVLEDVPYGRYRLEIRCPGFRMFSKAVTVSESKQTLRVGLSIAKVGDPESADLLLSGKVTPCSGESPLWVKFVGVFTDEAAEAAVGRDCEFRLTGLAGGRYLGFLIERETVKDIQVVELTLKSHTVVFSETAPAQGRVGR